MLSSSRGQGNFGGLEAKDLTFEAKDVLEDSISGDDSNRDILIDKDKVLDQPHEESDVHDIASVLSA